MCDHTGAIGCPGSYSNACTITSSWQGDVISSLYHTWTDQGTFCVQFCSRSRSSTGTHSPISISGPVEYKCSSQCSGQFTNGNSQP
jgi:hypothetical protein